MATAPTTIEVPGINLDNYFLDHQFYNTFVYVHKKFLPTSKKYNSKRQNVQTVNTYPEDYTVKNCTKRCDGSVIVKEKNKACLHNDAMLEQTIKFAKDIAPQVIPPSREFSPTPIYYTVKATTKPGKVVSKPCSTKMEYTEDTKLKKDKSKNHDKTLKKESIKNICETCSIKETVSHSSQDNTLDESRENRLLSCSLSEISEKIKNKGVSKCEKKNKREQVQNIITSDSLEAMATDLLNKSSEGKIKITLMNDTDKSHFSESLRIPIIDAIKQCLYEKSNQSELIENLHNTQNIASSNSQKLDYLIQRISHIEKKIGQCSDKKTKVIMAPKPISSVASKLEELAEDLNEIREENITDDELDTEANTHIKTTACKSAVVSMNYDQNDILEAKINDFGYSENVPVQLNATVTQLGVQSDRPNRIPTRFCWTDTNRRNT